MIVADEDLPFTRTELFTALTRLDDSIGDSDGVLSFEIAPQVSPGAPRSRILTFCGFWGDWILLDPAPKSIFLSKGRANVRSGDDF